MGFRGNDSCGRVLYEGEWQHDRLTGKGVLTFSNGERYDGFFKDGMVRTGSTRSRQDRPKLCLLTFSLLTFGSNSFFSITAKVYLLTRMAGRLKANGTLASWRARSTLPQIPRTRADRIRRKSSPEMLLRERYRMDHLCRARRDGLRCLC